MKKRVFGRKLSRGGGARKALFKSLTRALVLYGRITTTKAKGKAIVGEVEKLVSLARTMKNDRQIASFFGGDRKITSMFVKLSRSFGAKKGGFVRIINLPPRKGDAAQMLRLEWTDRPVSKEKDDAKKPKGKSVKSVIKKTGGKKIKEKETKKEK